MKYPQYHHLPEPAHGETTSSTGLSTGQKVGIGLGVTAATFLLAIALAGAVVYLLRYRRTPRSDGYMAVTEFHL